MSQHTKEPWIVGLHGGIYPKDGGPAIVTGLTKSGYLTNHAANENRIVDCVNYCAGISDERIKSDTEQGVSAKDQIEAYDIVRRQRDELLAALKYYVDAECKEETCGGGYWSLVDDGHVAREAIAKVEANHA